MTYRNKILQGDCLSVLKEMPDNLVDCVVTSPPYWGLRDYGVPGQLGLEKTPQEYISRMVEVFREVRRVMKLEASLWLNIGDSYNSSPSNQQSGAAHRPCHEQNNTGRMKRDVPGLKPKDLCGIPWMLAFALRDDGWWLRSAITLCKKNPMPESVNGSRWERHRVKVGRKPVDWKAMPKGWDVGEGSHDKIGKGNYRIQTEENQTVAEMMDCPGCPVCTPNDGYVLRMSAGRPTSATEMMFLFTKSASYFYDAEAVREPSQDIAERIIPNGHRSSWKMGEGTGRIVERNGKSDGCPSNGRNLRNWWPVVSEPFPGAHFATFGQKWIEPCIKAGTSEKGYCPECGKPWVRVVEKGNLVPDSPEYRPRGNSRGDSFVKNAMTPAGDKQGHPNFHYEKNTTGWRPSCSCSKDPIPGLCLDPFSGAGTVAVVAKRLLRDYIGLELNPDYIAMSEKRLAMTPAQGRLF